MISIIAAVSKNGVIGMNGQIPWFIPGEQKRFKEITMGYPIVMGRKTFESIGRVLPGRENVVLTSDKSFRHDNVTVLYSFDEIRKRFSSKDYFVIGGSTLYEEFLSDAEKLYLTLIDADIEGDTHFSKIPNNFVIIDEEKHEKDFENKYNYSYITYARKSI